jgi:hypothetical protein
VSGLQAKGCLWACAQSAGGPPNGWDFRYASISWEAYMRFSAQADSRGFLAERTRKRTLVCSHHTSNAHHRHKKRDHRKRLVTSPDCHVYEHGLVTVALSLIKAPLLKPTQMPCVASSPAQACRIRQAGSPLSPEAPLSARGQSICLRRTRGVLAT